MATIGRALASGRPVILGTLEADGHVIRMVRDRVDLGRRLARAVARPAAGPVMAPGDGTRARGRHARRRP